MLYIKLFTDTRLSYSTKNVFKTVNLQPVDEFEVKKFNFGDYINASVTVTNRPGVAMNLVTYLIVNDGEMDYHYYVTSIRFLSRGKVELGLVRNVWSEVGGVDIIGTITRGQGKGIERYKPNTIQFSEQKQAEFFVKDDFMKDDGTYITSGGMWGIAYCSQADGNKQININSMDYVVSGNAMDNNKYYYNMIRGNLNQECRNNIVVFAVSGGVGQSVRYHYQKYTDCVTDIMVRQSDEINFIFDEYTLQGSVVTSTFNGFREMLNNNNVMAVQIEFNEDSYVSDLRTHLENTYSVRAYPTGANIALNKSILDKFSFPEYPDTIDSGKYIYSEKSTIQVNDGRYVQAGGQIYKTEVKYKSDRYTESENNTVFAVDKGVVIGPDGFISTKGVIFGEDFSFVVGDVFQYRNFNYAQYVYTAMSDAGSVTIDASKANGSVVLKEPYGIIALPLFDITDTTGRDYVGLESQEFFYNLISQYSGGNAPFIVDAQIIPYAPNDFKLAYNGSRIDMSKLKSAVAGDVVNYNGFPPCMVITTADITVDSVIDLGAYDDVQKEYTLNKYRIKAPSQASAFDFKYYDYSSSKSITLQVDITLKPFGTYMHCAPVVQQGAISNLREFDDIRGVVSDKGIFECTMTSNAFETYKRENMMYEDIQERTIETLSIDQRTERVNEVTSGIVATAQATALGAMAGSSFGGPIGAGVGGVAGGVATGAAYAVQYAQNEKLRARELSDADYFYRANLRTIQALPDTISRVSTFNQDILNKFAFFVEKYGAPLEQVDIYDEFVEQVGNSLDVPGNVVDYLVNGKYIQARVLKLNARPEISEQIKNDLEKGVYYYDSI